MTPNKVIHLGHPNSYNLKVLCIWLIRDKLKQTFDGWMDGCKMKNIYYYYYHYYYLVCMGQYEEFLFLKFGYSSLAWISILVFW
jgi:hypothetical protein